MNWIATWLAAGQADWDKDDGGFIKRRTHRLDLLVKLYTARQERDLARAETATVCTLWHADIDSYNKLFHECGLSALTEKVRNLEHEIMGLVIAYRELSEARETIAMLTQERDALLSRLGEWRERIERMDELA